MQAAPPAVIPTDATRRDPWRLATLLLRVAALLTAGAAAIHFAVIPDHIQEFWLFGLLFALVASLQLVWAILVLARPSRSLLLAGLFGSVAVAGVWALSRTAGVPVGPEAGRPEAVAFIDALSTAFELLTALAVGMLLRAPSPRSRTAVGTTLALTLAAAFVVIALTTASILSANGHHGLDEHHHMAAVVHGRT